MSRTFRSIPFAALALLMLAAPAARAAVFAVTKTADTLDGACDLDCSLREAIVAANATPGADTILLGPGTYTLTRAGADEEAAATGDLDVTDDLAVVGAGASSTVIDGGGIDRIFDIAADHHVDLLGMTLRNGRAVGGGAIRNFGHLTIAKSTLTGNATTAFGFGGAILSDGQASLVVTDSAIANNTADGGGGGLALGAAESTLRNVTISGNRSVTDFGGGLYVFSDGKATLSNATITGNRAARGGGGVLVENSAFVSVDQPTFSNTIVAGNVAPANPDCAGDAVSAGFNLVGVGDGCIAFRPAANDVVGTGTTPLDPKLGPLGANGGPTPTQALLPGSPAIDAGSTAAPGAAGACEPVDQRGQARPADGTGHGPRCDIGAFEASTGCVPGGTMLCLAGGRFSVSAAWRTAQASGAGQAIPLTGDTGYFWFFDAANVEVVAKVLNACQGFDRYWVFLSGLTNVEVTVTVVDTVSGQTRTYSNPLNQRFRPVQDTNAFATCH
jgi:CSLREA domain-containing protein